MCKYASHGLLPNPRGRELSWSVIHIKFSFTKWGASEGNLREARQKNNNLFLQSGVMTVCFSVIPSRWWLRHAGHFHFQTMTYNATCVHQTLRCSQAQRPSTWARGEKTGGFWTPPGSIKMVHKPCSGELLQPYTLFFFLSGQRLTSHTLS